MHRLSLTIPSRMILDRMQNPAGNQNPDVMIPYRGRAEFDRRMTRVITALK